MPHLGGWWQEAWDFGREIAAGLVSSHLREGPVKERAQKQAAEMLFEDGHRIQVANLIHYGMPLDDTRNLRRRLRQAQQRGEEDEIMRLLGKIPEDERYVMFLALNAMAEAEFNEYIERLRHDPVSQFIQRMRRWIFGKARLNVRFARRLWRHGIRPELWELGNAIADDAATRWNPNRRPRRLF